MYSSDSLVIYQALQNVSVAKLFSDETASTSTSSNRSSGTRTPSSERKASEVVTDKEKEQEKENEKENTPKNLQFQRTESRRRTCNVSEVELPPVITNMITYLDAQGAHADGICSFLGSDIL